MVSHTELAIGLMTLIFTDILTSIARGGVGGDGMAPDEKEEVAPVKPTDILSVTRVVKVFHIENVTQLITEPKSVREQEEEKFQLRLSLPIIAGENEGAELLRPLIYSVPSYAIDTYLCRYSQRVSILDCCDIHRDMLPTPETDCREEDSPEDAGGKNSHCELNCDVT